MSAHYLFVTIALFLIIHVAQIDSCFIWGSDTGECSTESLDPLWRAANMPYCQFAITYPACLPRYTVRAYHIIHNI